MLEDDVDGIIDGVVIEIMQDSDVIHINICDDLLP